MRNKTNIRKESNLKSAREAANLSQVALAEKSGLSLPTIAGIEQGKRGLTTKNAKILGEILGVDPDYLLGLTEEKYRSGAPTTFGSVLDQLTRDTGLERCVLENLSTVNNHEYIAHFANFISIASARNNDASFLIETLLFLLDRKKVEAKTLDLQRMDKNLFSIQSVKKMYGDLLVSIIDRLQDEYENYTYGTESFHYNGTDYNSAVRTKVVNNI